MSPKRYRAADILRTNWDWAGKWVLCLFSVHASIRASSK